MAREGRRLDEDGTRWRRRLHSGVSQLSDLGVCFLFPSSQFSGWKPVPLDPAGSSLLLRRGARLDTSGVYKRTWFLAEETSQREPWTLPGPSSPHSDHPHSGAQANSR